MMRAGIENSGLAGWHYWPVACASPRIPCSASESGPRRPRIGDGMQPSPPKPAAARLATGNFLAAMSCVGGGQGGDGRGTRSTSSIGLLAEQNTVATGNAVCGQPRWSFRGCMLSWTALTHTMVARSSWILYCCYDCAAMTLLSAPSMPLLGVWISLEAFSPGENRSTKHREQKKRLGLQRRNLPQGNSQTGS
jgi:hypothetical protein